MLTRFKILLACVGLALAALGVWALDMENLAVAFIAMAVVASLLWWANGALAEREIL